MVIDLTIGHKYCVITLQRLATVARTDDCQPAVSQHCRHSSRPMNCQLVRPTMGNTGDHSFGQLLIRNTPQANKTTHQPVFT